MSDRAFVLLQHVLPKTLMTRAFGCLANRRLGAVTPWVIRRFIARYGVDMTEAQRQAPEAYTTFNDFFTRALRPGARPLASAQMICPADGAVSQFGTIAHDQIFQAKGKTFGSGALLAGDPAQASRFNDGQFATIYLSPRDYHRIHMPCDGRLRSMRHVPGALYSVNPATARGVDALFARNERVVCDFDSPHGPFAMVLVGAAIVGSIATVWHGIVNPRSGDGAAGVSTWDYAQRDVFLKQGEEMGHFQLGSTVVLLVPPGMGRFSPDWSAGCQVRMGEAMIV
ncbi:archaetidylserine decarboxylase [Pandoraea pnomenusa]|uniref:archaetidylserine decarboxylase n=1 Tax=Pandoraea pnomenusa TaxID=93220 RepID=UPI0007BC888E|nr:archaetidylserine decarboxylase [Pandoraea pnomenusa]ANC47381.1 phosphatidylserine decarboxylase [Pandoraea pnomenusa]